MCDVAAALSLAAAAISFGRPAIVQRVSTTGGICILTLARGAISFYRDGAIMGAMDQTSSGPFPAANTPITVCPHARMWAGLKTFSIDVPVWIPVMVTCPAAWLLHRRVAAAKPGTCPACRYDLSGLGQTPTCPECGCRVVA
jgi:hypothetical protein